MSEEKRNPAQRLEIRDIRFVPTDAAEAKTGLRGFVSLVLNRSLKLDGLALRQTREGRWTLSFPSKLDASGHRHFHIRPLDDATRREIEAQVFQALGLEGARKR